MFQRIESRLGIFANTLATALHQLAVINHPVLGMAHGLRTEHDRGLDKDVVAIRPKRDEARLLGQRTDKIGVKSRPVQ